MNFHGFMKKLSGYHEIYITVTRHQGKKQAKRKNHMLIYCNKFFQPIISKIKFSW